MKHSTRKEKHGDQPSVSEEAAFEFGVVYSACKDELIAFAAQESNPYTFADVAARVGRLLEIEALRQQSGAPQLVPEMRKNGARHYRGRPAQPGYHELDPTAALFDGAPRGRPLKRRMSAAARARIGRAQRKRWKQQRLQARLKEIETAREQWQKPKRVTGSPRYEAQRARALKQAEHLKRVSNAARGYWAKMTPEERAAEMARRKAVTAAKTKGVKA